MRRFYAGFSLLILVSMSSADVSGGSAAQAFATDAARAELSSARSLKCDFPWYGSAGDWKDDSPPIPKSGKQQFGFHIDGIDRPKQAARLIGNAGSEDLLVVANYDATAFIEQTPAG